MVLSSGECVETGTHEELLAKGSARDSAFEAKRSDAKRGFCGGGRTATGLRCGKDGLKKLDEG